MADCRMLPLLTVSLRADATTQFCFVGPAVAAAVADDTPVDDVVVDETFPEREPVDRGKCGIRNSIFILASGLVLLAASPVADVGGNFAGASLDLDGVDVIFVTRSGRVSSEWVVEEKEKKKTKCK